MSIVERKSASFSIVLTGLFLIAFIICCIVIKQPPKVVYKTVQIQLATTPVKTPQTETKAQSKQPVKKAEQKPAAPKTQTAPKAKTEPKTLESKTESRPKETTGPKIKKSVEELMAEQNAPKTKKAEWDESLFEDTATVQSTNAPAQKTAQAKSSVSGTAATGSKTSESQTSASSSSSSFAQKESAASSSTQAALANLASTSYSTTVADGVKSKTDIIADSTSGKVTIQMTDGKARQLLSPSKPVILIDEDNARLLDTSRTVTINFTVNADGSVPLSGITISPSSVLPVEIQQEIKEQISSWTFSQDPSGTRGIASFKYTLEIK